MFNLVIFVKLMLTSCPYNVTCHVIVTWQCLFSIWSPNL